MSDFVNGPMLLKCLQTALLNSEKADFAVAFWGKGAADALGIKGGKEIRIVCNLMSGGTNPHEIRILRERGASVRQLNDLHAKLGVIDDLSFIGSSNMSTNGFGIEGASVPWQEANVVFGNARDEIKKMFKAYWGAAVEIEDAHLVAAERVWAARRKENAVSAACLGGQSLIEFLRAAPEHLDALNVRMVVYDEVTNQDDQAILNDATEQAHQTYGSIFDVYWDWDSMTTDAAISYLVDYEWPNGGKIEGGTLYRRDQNAFADFKDKEGNTFHVAYKVKSIEGIQFGAEDKAAICEAFHEYVNAGAKGEGEKGQHAYNFPISELARYLLA